MSNLLFSLMKRRGITPARLL